jgi:hypothetical protein
MLSPEDEQLVRDIFWDVYFRCAGEVEARNAARRRKLTDLERRAIPPWETMDVPWDAQLLFERKSGD